MQAELEVEHHTIERLVHAHAAYGLKSCYDVSMLETAGLTRMVHLKQILASPAHALMEETRDLMREALRTGDNQWQLAGLNPDRTLAAARL